MPSALEEVTEADALLHVVDLSHPAWQSQLRSVMSILSEMPVTPGPACLKKLIRWIATRWLWLRKSFPRRCLFPASARLSLETLRQRLAQLIHYAVAPR